MEKIKNIVQILNKYSDLTVLLIIFFTSLYMMKDSVLFFDDIVNHFLPGGISFYKDFYYGSWVMELQNIIFYYIPYKLEINLQDWALNTAGIIKSIIITSLMYCCICIIKLHYKGKTIRYCSVLIFYYLFIKYVSDRQFGDFMIIEGFFRFILPSVLICAFLYKFYNFAVLKKTIDFSLYFLAFICASSSEIASSICLISVMLVVIHFLIEKENKQNIKNSVLIFLTLTAGTVFLICSTGFQAHFIHKHSEELISIGAVLSYLPEFFKIFYNKLICDFKFYYLIVFVFIFLQYKRISKIRIFFPLYIIFACLFFCFSLVIMGKTSYLNDFWLQHADIYTVITIVMNFVILLSLCNYLAYANKKEEKILLVLFLITAILTVNPFINTVRTISSTVTNTRNYVYLRDKIRLFYAYRNEIPVMPIITCVTFTYNPVANINVVDTDTYIPKYGADITSDINTKVYEQMQKNYYPIVFKKTKDMFTHEHIIEDSIIAIQKFKSLGGSTEEIKADKTVFSKLSDEKFVLNQ